jgi:beta-xylosidase
LLDGLHDVDVLAHVPGGAAVAVEFDGPTHFLRWIEPASASRRPEPNGATLFRDRLLREAGHTVVSIPYFEWSALKDDDTRDAYITRRFESLRQ